MASSYAVVTDSLFDNGYTSDQTNYLLSSPLARWVFTTSAHNMYLKTWCTIYGTFPQYAHIGVWINGSYYTTLVCTGANENYFNITLPAGRKTVQLITGLQVRFTPPMGTFIKSVYFSGAGDTEQVTPNYSNRLLCYGDSIVVGANAPYPTGHAWPVLLRNNYSRSVMVEGGGSRTLQGDCPDADGRTTFAALLAAYDPSTIWLAIGTNDFGLSTWSSSDFGIAYADLLDKLHTELPTVPIYCQTPLTRTDEAEKTGGHGDLPAYRTEIVTAVSTRTEYCTLVNGPGLITSFDDNVHPDTDGHAEYAAAVNAVLA